MERISSLIERLIAPLRSAVADVVREELRRQHRDIIDAAAAEVKDAEEEIARLKATAARERSALQDATAELIALEKRIGSLSLDLLNERHKSDRLADELAKTQTELADAVKAPRAPAKAPAAPKAPATKPTTREVRSRDTALAKAVHCPTCAATPGDACISDDGKGRIAVMHPERYAAGRARSSLLADGLSRPCPECGAAVNVPCVVNGKRGLHERRKTPAT